MNNQYRPGDQVKVYTSLHGTKYGTVQRLAENRVFVKHFDGSIIAYRSELVEKNLTETVKQPQRSIQQEAELIKSILEAKKHTVPQTDKEKDLAAMAHPKDKITHKDVLVGRGVLAKEEEEVDLDEVAHSPFRKAAIALRNMSYDKSNNEDDRTDYAMHADLLASKDPKHHEQSAKHMSRGDTYMRDKISDTVHRNSSKQNSAKYHKLAGVTRLKEGAEAFDLGEEQQGVAEGASSDAELARLAHKAYVAATRQGNGVMAAHYLKQHMKYKAAAAKAKPGVKEEVDLDEADQLATRVTSSKNYDGSTPSSTEVKRRQEFLKKQMKYRKNIGGLAGPKKGQLPEEAELDEAQFWGNKQMAKQAAAASGSTTTMRGKDAKGVYTATLMRKKGESDHKEVSRVYDTKEEVDLGEMVNSTLSSYTKKAIKEAVRKTKD